MWAQKIILIIKKKIKDKNTKVISYNNNNNERISQKYLSENNSYQNIFQNQIDSYNKDYSASSQIKTNRSRNNNINNTVTHNINLNNTSNINESNSNLNMNNLNKKIRISLVGNITNNTAFSTINKQKNNQSIRQSKYTNNNKKCIPINNKYNPNNSNYIYNDEINYIDEEDYCDSNKLKNIPTNILIRLRDWLISCDLLCYYNLFIAKNMYNIDSYIHDIQEGLLTLSYKDIEKLGIKKPGHIFRILIKLEIDAGIIDINLYNFIVEKINNYYSNTTTTIALTSSINNINCCGINFGSNDNNNNNKKSGRNNENYYNDLSSFLRAYNLYKFKGNFLYNGFDKIEYIIIQLFSKYAFNKQILKEYLHVYITKDRNKLLSGLYKVKINIAKEFGIEIDEEEINNFFKSMNKGNKYNSNNKNYHFNEDTSNNSIKKSMSNYYFNNSSLKKSNSFCEISYKKQSKNMQNNENLSDNYCNIF